MSVSGLCNVYAVGFVRVRSTRGAQEAQSVTDGGLDSAADQIIGMVGLPTGLQRASRECQSLCVLTRNLKAETVSRIMILQDPRLNHHGILEFMADLLNE